ncbi:MAG: hypothetical protein R3A52_27015 [Polyangiales bacterium]
MYNRERMAAVRLIHWNATEAKARIKQLRAAGHAVTYTAVDGGGQTRGLADDPPELVLIDLTRMPSHGRSVGVMLRQKKSTRRLPLLFVGGADEKVARVRETLPDAAYCGWDEVASAIPAAIASAPRQPKVPKGLGGAMTDTPLWKKLGFTDGSRAVTHGAPMGFVDLLGDLPKGAAVVERGEGDLHLWFVRAGEDLEADVLRMAELAGTSPLWIAWPKKSSGVESDLNAALVIGAGRAAGRVDCKLCAIDATWSAVQFRPSKQGEVDDVDELDLDALRR